MEPTLPSSSNVDPGLRETQSCDEEGAPEAAQSGRVPSVLARGSTVHRYIIFDRVGEGGMGVVYAAYDPRLDRRVAVKFLAPHEADSDGVREKRLLREAQAMARLSHPNVAVVYEVGTFQSHLFLAMEFVDGVDLRTWMAEKPRSFPSILDMFRAAGRGLAAAHAAGIIHRDFKPENVLVDKHGRPRVTDFGLSRATHDPEEGEPGATVEDSAAAPSSPSHLSAPLTRTGGVLGTPSYIAPEQQAGGMVDARSDQFSFCVALYEALYGEHPFKGSRTERIDDAAAGRVAPASAPASVPKWCRQVLLRGLAAAPENRFPSMEALLAALSFHPFSKRRQIVVAASLGVILTSLGAITLLFERSTKSPGPRCDLGAQRLAGVWDEARKRQLREAFQKSGARGADATWKSFSAILDGRAKAWVTMHNDACAATHLDGVQSPAVLDLRMECLDRKRQEMKSIVDVYSDKPDASSLNRAVSAAYKLSSVSACADISNLSAVVSLPDDPHVRAKVQSLRQRLIHSRALKEAGRYEQGREYMASLKQEADTLGYAPLAAEAATALAIHLSLSGKLDEAEKVLFDAAKQAVKGRDVMLEAEIWLTLLYTFTRAGRVPEGLVTARVADRAIERAGGDNELRAELANACGTAEFNAGNYNEALRQFRRATELWRKSSGATPGFADALGNVGIALALLGRTHEALDNFEQALAVRRTILRPDHPDIGTGLDALAWAYRELELFHKARDVAQSALDIRMQELGPEHQFTIASLQLIATLEVDLGNVEHGLELFTTLLSIQKRVLDPRNVYVSATYLGIGEAQRRLGRSDEAERSFQQAIDHNARAGSPEHFNTGYAFGYLGFLHNSRRLYGRALRECRRAFGILSREVGQDSSYLVPLRECIGEALIGAGKFEDAREELERALTPAAERDSGPSVIAGARFQLARALWATPAERPRAQAIASAALNTLMTGEGDNRELTARIQSWLKAHEKSPIRDSP